VQKIGGRWLGAERREDQADEAGRPDVSMDGVRSQSPHTSDEAPVMGVEQRRGRKVDA